MDIHLQETVSRPQQGASSMYAPLILNTINELHKRMM